MHENILKTLWKPLVALAVIGILSIIFVVPYIFNESTIKEATLVAKNTAKQYSNLRTYYTQNVVSKLSQSDLFSASSDHKNNKFKIPLPATMIHELSDLSESNGLQIKLYSAFPFPERADRILDPFQQQAWQQLNLNPNEPFVISQIVDDKHLVRVAIADLLTDQACVDCHNNHPLTPKIGWELGDVRGVLEVVVPIDQQLTWLHTGSYQLSIIFSVIFMVIFTLILYLLNQESKKKISAVVTPFNNQKMAMNAHSLLSMADKDGTITFVNDLFCTISGYTKEELMGKKHSILNSNNQPKSYWREMHKMVLAGDIWHDEVLNRTKDGHYYWVDTTIVPNYDSKEEINGFTSIRTDITQKKKNEDLLVQAKDQAELSTANLLIAQKQSESAKFALDQHSLVSVTSLDGVITYVNDKFVEISGYQRHEIMGKNQSLIDSNYQPASYWQDMEQTVLSGKIWRDEVRNRAKDGRYYWADTTIVANFDDDDDDNIIGFTFIRTDITQQKAALESLKIAKEQADSAKFALDQHSLVSVTELDGTITYANDKFVEISGYERNEILGKKHNLLNSNNQSKSYWYDMYQMVLSGKTWHDEVRNRAKDGSFYWVDTTIVPNFDMNNHVIGFTSIRTDITQKKEDAMLLSIAIEKAQSDAAQLLIAKNKAQSDAAELLIAIENVQSAKFALDQHSLVSVAELDGTITYVNDKFVEISGYQRSEILGKKHNLLNSNNQPKYYWHKMHQTVLSGKTWHDEVRNRAKDGSYYWVDTTIVPNFDSHRHVIGFTSIRTDISNQKELLESLALAKEEAEVASNSKADFLANMSHEIRTPMNGVIGMTNLLLASELTQEQQKLAKTVKSSADGLLSIINDILDFSKVEAGKLDLELIPFNLGKMIGDIGMTMSFQANGKGLQLICPASPILNEWVCADPGRIRQVLTNLIGNALKFTSQGEVAVYIRQVAQTDKQKTFRFDIKDTGIGITQAQTMQLFDKFSQADTSTTRKYGGTGLGLSICKKLVELMGGEIGVESEIGQGSNFWFTLALKLTQPVGNIAVYNADISNENILIVDDNETNLELMHQLHKIWKIPHKLVTNAQDALADLRIATQENTPYTIAILDMNMPEMNGLDLCEIIQKDEQLAHTKLIMASSQAQRGDALKMREAGFKGYITKPIQQSELFDVLLMVSGLKKSDSEFVTRHSSKDKQQFKAHILVVEDNATNQVVIEGLLSNLGISVDLAGNGEEAITALQNISDYDLVFMDCQMPILDGYEATKKIRAKHPGIRNSDLPIVAMTANAMIGDKQKCLDVGMSDYLSKPIEVEKVIAMLNKWLPNNSVVAQELLKIDKEQKPSVIKNNLNSEPDMVIFDYEDMAKRLMHSSELMKSVADIFYQDMIEQLDELKNYIENNDIEGCVTILHKIKGASANVGGKALSATALEMEHAGKVADMETIKAKLETLEGDFSVLKVAMEEALS